MPDPKFRRARNLVWVALGLGFATLLVDTLAYWMVSGTNSDMAGVFLYAGVPTLVVGGIVLAFGFFKGRQVVPGAASAALAVLVLGAAFVALIPRIWWSVYTGW